MVQLGTAFVYRKYLKQCDRDAYLNAGTRRCNLPVPASRSSAPLVTSSRGQEIAGPGHGLTHSPHRRLCPERGHCLLHPPDPRKPPLVFLRWDWPGPGLGSEPAMTRSAGSGAWVEQSKDVSSG